MSAQLLSALGWKSLRRDIPFNLPNLIHTDSRTIGVGQWFVPIVGEHFNGHRFIEDVIAKGAGGFFFQARDVSRLPESLLKFGIEVADTTRALQDLARWWRLQHKDCQVIGITGSSGKTSVKELLFCMLSSIGPTLKTEGSLNNELGVPLTLCRLTNEHRYAVIEMGARHRGDIEFLSRIAEQDVGVLLNVGTAHIGEFGGKEQILEAKMQIAHAPRCVYFRDDERIHLAMRALAHKEFVTFGMHPAADIQINEARVDAEGKLHLALRGQSSELVLPYFHESYAINVATVLAIGKSLGLALQSCVSGLENFLGVKGRFHVHRLARLTLIDDAYNANPQSMRAGLETLRQAYSSAAKVLILGDMNELGSIAEEAHREIGAFCAQTIRPLRLITVGRMARWIADSARSEGLAADRILSFDDVQALLPRINELTADAQLLYVKASNSLRLNKIIDTFLTK